MCSIRSLGDLATSFEFSFSMFDYLCKPIALTYVTIISIHLHTCETCIFQELDAFARKHLQHNHSGILKMLLAPSYRVLSSLTGIKSSSVLSKLPTVNTADLIEQAKSKKEMIFVQIGVSSLLFEVFTSGDFIKASEVILQYPFFFEMLNEPSAMMINKFGILYFAGLVCFHMTRRTKEQHWLTKGMNVLASYSE